MEIKSLTSGLSLKRTVDGGSDAQRKVVQQILQDVKERGDQALFFYTKKFDQTEMDSLKVTNDEMEKAIANMPQEMISIMTEAASNLRSYHEKQVQNSWIDMSVTGTMLGLRRTPLDSAGIYVPGGTAAYPSSVLMNAIPAKVAGVKRIVMVSPPGIDGRLPDSVLAAAHIAGITEIYKVGGAQAIGALAYGTESIGKVDKITGPGNIYVALAKREVYGDVDIDMIAGPSEITVLADETAEARHVAADLLSQAEHDERACSVLITTSRRLASQVKVEVEKQLAVLPRKEIALAAWNNFGGIYVANTLEEAIEAVNELAPEHLEIQTADAMNVAGAIRHAGAIFIGKYSSEPVGDYFAGPNHVLPTNGTARFSSPLNVDDFQKKTSLIMYSQQDFEANASKIAAFARLEGLEAHARAVESRFISKEEGQ
ncbi:histidinol dehydrogenase [Bacillus sp. FJAT-27986]|uniref:histidinol dehydrogenase n=1 Tax=Bacillus sp. FJAT-27986 TaxID=1743146 RepID=UPI00080AC455|nr:histidinol dehydrogenase [Bacillus sp. FJAT-27986]OCA84720.1 histidinol dehydrogenase [Bacillus sp. FJAT-27986]